MNRKLLALTLSAVMAAAAVTGCSSSKKETEAQTKAQTEAQTEAKTEAKTEAAAPETEAAAAVEEAVSEAISEAAAIAEEALSEAQEAVEEAATEVQAAAEEAATEVQEAVEEAATEVQEAVEEAATEAQELVEEAISEAQESLDDAVDTAAAAAAAATALLSDAEEAAETEAAAVEEAIETEAAAVEEAIETEAAAVEEAIETEAAAVEEAIETEAAEVEEIVETEVTVAEETVETEEEAIESALEEAPELPELEETEELTEEETEDDEDGEVIYEVSLAGEGVTGSYADMQIDQDDIVILYVNDVHGGISADKDYSGSDMSLGYAGLAAVKAEAEQDAAAVTTVDNGDAIQGSVVTTESDGQDAMTLMDLVGFDIRIPGNHEFDYGMDAFLDYANNVEDSEFICSNFIDNTTGEAIFDGYTLVDYEINDDIVTIGYVGMCTPETIAKSTPTYFQDEEGNYIYGFDAETPQNLYDNIQASIDEAYEAGADFVIGLAHMGDTGVESDWSSVAVAANTTGMDIILDGHAHSVLPGEIVTNLDGDDVLITSTGTKLNNIGVLKLSFAEDGEVTAQSGLVNTLSDEELASDAYAEVAAEVQTIEDKYAYLFVVEGSTDFDLTIYDPENTDERLIRKTETNMGDFLADAYRIMYNNDMGMINGGSIRANLNAGDINYMGIITVFPWNTEYSVVEVFGQTVLDALEMGAHLYPEECGGFMQVSGVTYKIDTTIPSSVNVNSDGEFVSVDGEYRVKDVMVGDEPLDLDRTYRLGINTYYSSEYGDGMTMFKNCKFVFPAEEAVESAAEEAVESATEESTEAEAVEEIPSEPVIDHDVIIAYLDSFGGKVPEEYANPYGQGRIVLITEEDKLAQEAAEQAAAEQESEGLAVSEAVAAAAAAVEAAAEAVEEEATEAAEKAEEMAETAEKALEEPVSEAAQIVEAAAEVIDEALEEMSEALNG